MYVHIEDTLATQASQVRASSLSFRVHYRIYSSFEKESGSSFLGANRPWYFVSITEKDTLELGTFFCAILRLIVSPFEMHCRVDDKRRQERSGDWERGMLRTLHRELCICSCRTRKRKKEEELNAHITLKSVPANNCFSDIKSAM